MVLGNPPKGCLYEVPAATGQDNNGREVSGDWLPLGRSLIVGRGLLAADLSALGFSSARGSAKKPAAPIRLLQSSASPVTIWRHVNPGRDNHLKTKLSCVLCEE